MKRIIILFILTLCTTSLFSQILPTEFKLHQNTPDPFDTLGTIIQFDLPRDAHVQLSLADSLGEWFTILVGDTFRPGVHQVNYIPSLRRLPGLYICKMLVDSMETTIFSDSITMHFQDNRTQFKLYQNLPNPFDSSGTRIPFDLPKPAFIYLRVEDVLGNTVDTLVFENKAAAYYNIWWDARERDGSKFSDGLYFCKMQADSEGTTIFSDSIDMYLLTIEKDTSKIVPTQFKLYQNTPNPFCDTSWTKISYDLPISAFIHLWVEDSLRDTVCTSVNTSEQPGVYSVKWNARKQDGSTVSPGLYVCKIQADSQGTTIFSDSITMHVDLCTSVGDAEGSMLPLSFILYQNYPNPFNPATIISYQLSTQSHVTLKVFNLLGREVATLVNAIEPPGFKSVNFNSNGLSSGVYYYRLQTSSFTETKKLLLLR